MGILFLHFGGQTIFVQSKKWAFHLADFSILKLFRLLKAGSEKLASKARTLVKKEKV